MLLLLPGAALSQGSAPAAQGRHEDFPRRVVVYVVGGISNDERTSIGSYMISSLINSGACISHENFAEFIAAVIGEEQSKRQYLLDEKRICEIGRHFGIRYVCMVTVTPSSGGVYTVAARMLNTETERAKLRGEASGPMRTVDDCWEISNTVVKNLLGKKKPEPEPVAAAVGINSGGFSGGEKKAGRGKTVLAVSLDVLGVLAGAYGVYENYANVKKDGVDEHVGENGRRYIQNGPEAEKAAKRRDIAYIVGGALLASGITVHIFF